MNLYLCGLNTPEPERAQRYADAAAALTALGHDVVSPYTSGLDDSSLTTDEALDADLAAVAAAQVFVSLDEGEPLLCFETVTAEQSGKPVRALREVLAAGMARCCPTCGAAAA